MNEGIYNAQYVDDLDILDSDTNIDDLFEDDDTSECSRNDYEIPEETSLDNTDTKAHVSSNKYEHKNELSIPNQVEQESSVSLLGSGNKIAGKTVYQILAELVHAELKLEELINIAVMLIGQIDADHPVLRYERRSKDRLKKRLEKSREKIIPIITNPMFQLNFYAFIWGNRMSPSKKKANQ